MNNYANFTPLERNTLFNNGYAVPLLGTPYSFFKSLFSNEFPRNPLVSFALWRKPHLRLSPITHVNAPKYTGHLRQIYANGGDMATFRKRGNRVRAEVCRAGIRKSKTFGNQLSAEKWARQAEDEIDAGETGTIPNKTFGDILKRYAGEVSSKKKGARWEVVRINKILRDPIASRPLKSFDTPDVGAWRNRQTISNESIRREWNLLSHACKLAVKEWKWLKANPFTEVERPPKSKPRKRRPTQDEIGRICEAGGYHHGTLETQTAKVIAAWLFAIETAMRAGEIQSITAETVHDDYVHLPETKNGHSRDVPLSKRARAILKQVEPDYFQLKSLSVLFAKVTKKAGVEGLTFHDSRREALSRLAKIYDPMELAKVSGHRDLKILLEVYYSPTVQDLAKKMKG